MAQVSIRPKEAAHLRGTGYDAAKALLQRIRAHFNKAARTDVSVGEFCQFTGLPLAEVTAALQPTYKQG
ncbi:hypothetical protein IC235_11325 [Hymenobacter sp. BT664]|uniref:Uncharacterized protein n=1 Tax=Hymenobacter montanus TaxID=2771359 RepID=A0A927BDV4_9BACT|nr:hypothetical protein [Hymenobacter montanus]MBD2768480.1 hypothetical protein [Hymenobacter montanus]